MQRVQKEERKNILCWKLLKEATGTELE
jgi:hypothetical protein